MNAYKWNKGKELIRGSIACNGVKPRRSEVYTLAAELVKLHGIVQFKTAIYCAMLLYDDYDYDDDDDYYYYDYYYYYYYCDYYYHNYYYYSISEKVIALLFLAAIHS